MSMGSEATVERWPAVAGLPRVVVRGGRREVFEALGEEFRHQIADLRAGALESWGPLVARAAGPARAVFGAVRESSRRELPVESGELGALAAGADLPEDDLWALNLRGDLGSDGTGCSDAVTFVAGAPVVAHNEDGGSDLVGRLALVTLDIDGDPAMTSVWYPGMLPSNAFVVTAAGLAFGMDHLPVVDALREGVGRHLLARHAQRAPSGPEALGRLGSIPCAGGFAFTVTDLASGSVDVVETIAGSSASTSVTTGMTAAHTNHARVVPASHRREPAPQNWWLGESRTRLGRLEGLLSACGESPDDLLACMRHDGVRNRSEDLWTYVTALVDGVRRRVTLCGDGDVWSAPVEDFARGLWGTSGSEGAR